MKGPRHVVMKAKSEVVQWEAKRRQRFLGNHQKPGKRKTGFTPSGFRGNVADTLISDFQPPEVWRRHFSCFKPPQFVGLWCGSPRKLAQGGATASFYRGKHWGTGQQNDVANTSLLVRGRIKRETQALWFHSLYPEALYNPAPVMNSSFHIPHFALRCLYGNCLMI